MAAFGLASEIEGVPVQAEDDIERFEVWPENAQIVEVFMALHSQWDIVANEGRLIRTGINYSRLETVLKLKRGIKRKDWADIFDGIRVMELEALTVMAEKRSRQA